MKFFKADGSLWFETLPLVIDDGGRKAAGFKGVTGDCVARAVSIAANLPYREVYDALSRGAGGERRSKWSKAKSATVRNGIHVRRKWFKEYMASLGFVWTPTMGIGSGCKVHLRVGELPTGRLVVSCSKHYVAVIDGVVHDLYDPGRDGTRCVYGYYAKTRAPVVEGFDLGSLSSASL